MKEEAIKKINKMGKVAGIIAKILRVFVCIGFGGCLVGIVALAALPRDFVTVTTSGELEATVDIGAFGHNLTDKEKEKIEAEIKKDAVNGKIKVGDLVYGNVKLNVEGNSIKVQAAGSTGKFTLKNIIWPLVVVAISLVCTYVTLLYAGFLCKAFRDCTTPFEENVIKAMRHLAFALIPWVFLSSLAEGVSTAALLQNAGEINFGLNMPVVMTVLIIFGLTYVFKYGAMLQKESDETL